MVIWGFYRGSRGVIEGDRAYIGVTWGYKKGFSRGYIGGDRGCIGFM